MQNALLASASPRRRELISLIFDEFDVYSPDVDEELIPGVAPDEFVGILSARKAAAGKEYAPDKLIIAADTIVVLDDKILGKPKDEADARAMLTALSGRSHTVYTGVTIIADGEPNTFVCDTRVEFYPISSEMIDWYIATGEPLDKAGAYGIQGKGALIVKGIEGDYYNVMGLPVGELFRHLPK